MEVTRRNFDTVLPTLTEVFKKAQFIAVDTEFTGLKVEGASGINYFDTLEDLYLKYRLRAETFLAIQIGFAAFIFDEKTNKYSHLGYNFYVYPSSYLDVNFTCQNGSIQFLVEHDFDFNKLFKDGIPYLKDEDIEKLLEKLTGKYKKKNNSESLKNIEIPNSHKTVIDGIISRIQEILQSKRKTSFTTEKFNSYMRRLIYNSLESTFGSSVLVESNKDETMTISVGFTAEEVKDKQNEKFLMEKQKILDEAGFSKVIKLLIESKKLLVGHNFFLDLLFIIKQFLAPLPSSYSEFKEMISFLFPNIIDTKYLAATEFKNIRDTSLNCIVEYFKDSFTEVPVHKNGVGYKIEDKKLHEASYDAYLTGLCFLKMAEHLGGETSISNKNLSESFILQPLFNKLSIPRLHDITFMNLGGSDKLPDRSGVYHLTFPKEWVRDNIYELFKNSGTINIAWINSTSAFIKVKKEYIKEVDFILKNKNENYILLPYNEFKSLNCTSPDSLLGSLNNKPSKTNLKDSNNGNNGNNDLPSQNNFNDSINKRKVEDIGEVIERPQKKHCSNKLI